MNTHSTEPLLIGFVLGFTVNSALAQEANPYDVMGETGIPKLQPPNSIRR